MTALADKWCSLLQKASVEMHAQLAVVEEGYYLLAAPSSSGMPVWLRERAETEANQKLAAHQSLADQDA